MTELADNATVLAARRATAFRYFILLTAVLCGALVMVIEVVGSRVIGPFFGVSLFVWTSLITVTLLALALGYAVGGYASDRWRSPSMLYLIVITSGVLALLVPVLKAPTMKIALDLGLRGGAFCSTLLLFGPTLFLLGCVSPYLVKIATRELKDIGKTVGGLYALSTLGSTLGTLLTGFLLVGYLGIDRTFLVIGSSLILLGLLYFLLFERRWLGLTAILLPVVLYHPVEFSEKILADGSTLKKIYAGENYYGSLKVIDTKSESKHARYLLLDNTLQGGIDLENGMSSFPYSYYLQFLTYLNNPDGLRCLSIGIGIGAVAKWYDEIGKTCDAVDINPAIFDVAKRYFGYQPKGETIIEDGRYLLSRTSKTYDYVILDVFSGELTPAHLLSAEAVKLIAEKLSPGGVLGINLINRLQSQDSMMPSIVATLKTVFQQVEVYPVLIHENQLGNIVLLAYQGESRRLDITKLDSFPIHPFYRNKILNHIGTRYTFPNDASAIILTDDYNPIDYFESSIREAIRQNIQQTIDWDLQIS